MNRGKGEVVCMVLAITLFGLGLFHLRTWGARVSWNSYPVFLPAGLLMLSTINGFLRSKVLGWSVFTFSFIFSLMIFGAFTMAYRASSPLGWTPFARSLGMYAALAMTGLYQLRFGAPARRS